MQREGERLNNKKAVYKKLAQLAGHHSERAKGASIVGGMEEQWTELSWSGVEASIRA